MQRRTVCFPKRCFRRHFESTSRLPTRSRRSIPRDAYMGLVATAFRRQGHGIDVAAIMQTIGTENLGSKVGVAATGYILGLGYVRSFAPVKVSTGFRHLSSHLTRDLDDKQEQLKQQGRDIPTVADGSEYNVVYIKASATLSAVPMTPQILVAVVPNQLSIRRTRREPGAPPLCGDQLATLARRGFGRLSRDATRTGNQRVRHLCAAGRPAQAG